MKIFISMLMIVLAGNASAVILENRGFESGDFAGWRTQGKGWGVDGKHSTEGLVSAQCAVLKGDQKELRACVQLIKGAQSGKRIKRSNPCNTVAGSS